MLLTVKRLGCFLPLSLSLIGTVSPADAACARPYVVLGSPGGANLYAEPGGVGGFLPELVALVGRRSGCSLRVELLPPERLIALAEVAEADILGNVSRGRTIPTDRDFVAAAQLPVEFVVDRRRGIQSPQAVLGASGALVGRMRRGAEPTEVRAFFDALAPENIDQSEDMDTLARKLAAGRIVGFFGTPLYYRHSTESAGLGDNARGWPFKAQPYRIGWSMLHARVAPADRAVSRKTLEALVRSGEVDALLARHAGKGQPAP
ncbi:hypothetical protein [Niveibacterium sp.]|uniref:hypothetical protein n=1 Tax=Niveibacterium sp. TaxID=2017444 RepID=UPI0035B3A7B8